MGLNILVSVDDTVNAMLTQSVSSAEVNEKIDQATSYKLDFMVDVCDGDIAKTLQKATKPGSTLSILASINSSLICLAKGPITHMEENLQHGGAGSWIHIEGEDTTQNMDHTVNFVVSDSVTDSDIATKIITNNKMSADVESTPDSSHDENNHSHVQRETDLSLIRSLGRRNGYHFWVTYTDKGVATGHFRSRNLKGDSTADLIINRDTYNIDSFHVNVDPRRPSKSEGKQLDLRKKNVLGGTYTLDDQILGTEGLSTIAGQIVQSMFLSPPVDDAGAMKARNEAALRDAQWFINATCHTNLHRLGKIVRNHSIVSVLGAGSIYEGKYYVTSVTHKIDAADHKMDLELSRNAWGN